MADMPRPRPPHLHRQISRHGTVTWVVRFGNGPRTYITAEHGSPEFEAQYHAAIRGEAVPAPARAASGTLQWLWDRYRKSSAWVALSPATRRQRENIMGHVLKTAGGEPFTAITRKSVIAGRERRSATPSQANNFLNAMRHLFAWAIDAEHVKDDPTRDVKNVKRPKTGGFAVWTDDDVAAFEKRWPVGSRERLALAILLYTGLRRGDASQLGRQHVKDGVIRLRTEKTDTPVTIPILPELAAMIAATPIKGLAFIATPSGKAMTKESFGNWFSEAARAAGIEKSAHGLRKAGATRAANNGATVNQLEAIFGWSGGQMASLYTRSADRERLSMDATSKLSISNLPEKVGNGA